MIRGSEFDLQSRWLLNLVYASASSSSIVAVKHEPPFGPRVLFLTIVLALLLCQNSSKVPFGSRMPTWIPDQLEASGHIVIGFLTMGIRWLFNRVLPLSHVWAFTFSTRLHCKHHLFRPFFLTSSNLSMSLLLGDHGIRFAHDGQRIHPKYLGSCGSENRISKAD